MLLFVVKGAVGGARAVDTGKFYSSNAPVISRGWSLLQLRLLRRILPFKASNANLYFVEQTRRSGKIIITVNNSVGPTAAGFAT